MILSIIANNVALAFYDYYISDNHTNNDMSRFRYIDLINNVFTIIFIIEAILKSIVFGFLFHEHSYLRNGWNRIDIIVIITGVAEYIIDAKTSILLRTLRVIFRPLKLINHVKGMKRLVESLIEALPDFANVGVFLIFVFTLFATMGL